MYNSWKEGLRVFAVVLFLAATSVAATVRGQLVHANDNSPAAYVAIRLNSNTKGASQFAHSGSDGRFYLENVPPGDYTLEVWRGGQVIWRSPITVQEPTTDAPTIRLLS